MVSRISTPTTPQTDLRRSDPTLFVRKSCLGFAQGLFSESERGAFHWCEDSKTTEIHIMDGAPVDVATYNALPIITLTMGNLQWTSVGIGDMDQYDFRTGQEVKTALIAGLVRYNCSSRNPHEASRIGFALAEHIWLLRKVMLRVGIFFDFGRQPQVTPPTRGSDVLAGAGSDAWYTVFVTVPFQLTRSSSAYPLNQRVLQSIEARMAILGVHSPSSGAAKGVVIDATRPPPFSAATDAYGGTPVPGGDGPSDLQRIPHPLNPAQTITIRVVR